MLNVFGNVLEFNTRVGQIFLLCARFIIILAFFVFSGNALADSFGDPLVDAADLGDKVLVGSLLKNGHLPDSKGDFGTTALLRAAFRGNVEIIELLIEGGAFINAADIGGETALHLAAKNGQIEAVKKLLYYGAYIDVPDKEQWTPLMRATLAKQSEIVKELIDKGADINAVNSVNESVLVHAAIAGIPDIAAMITHSKKAKEISKEQEQKAIILAKRKGHNQVEKMITAFSDDDNNAKDTKTTQKEDKSEYKNAKYKTNLLDESGEDKKVSEQLNKQEKALPDTTENNKTPAERPFVPQQIQQQAPYKSTDQTPPQKPLGRSPDILESQKIAESSKPIELLSPEQNTSRTPEFLKPATSLSATNQSDGSFFIQLGTFKDRQAARLKWAQVLADNQELLGKFPMSIVDSGSSLSQNNTMYRLRAGSMYKTDAENTCQKLRSKNLDCYVIEVANISPKMEDKTPSLKQDGLPLSNKTSDMVGNLDSVKKQEDYFSNHPKLKEGSGLEANQPIARKPDLGYNASSIKKPFPAVISENNTGSSSAFANGMVLPEAAYPEKNSDLRREAEKESLPNPIRNADWENKKSAAMPASPKTNDTPIKSPSGKDMSDPAFEVNNYYQSNGGNGSYNNDNFLVHKDEIRNEIQERTRQEYFSRQGIKTPVQRPKKEYDDFYNKMKNSQKDSYVSEAVMVPDEAYFTGSVLSADISGRTSNWLNIYNLPDASFANDYWVRMFKSDESLGNVQFKISKADSLNGTQSGVKMRIGPIAAEKASALCNSVRAGGFGCSVLGDGSNEPVSTRTPKSSPAGRQEENPLSGNINPAGAWINLGTFPSNSEAEYYWMFIKENNNDLLNALQYKMMKNKNEQSVKLLVGSLDGRERALQLCNIMRYRNIACLVIE